MKHLRALSTEATGELDVLGLNGDTLGVDGTQVGVLEQGDEVCLNRFCDKLVIVARDVRRFLAYLEERR